MRLHEAIQLAAATAQDNQSLRRASWRVDYFIRVKDNAVIDINGRLASPSVQDILANDWEILVPATEFESDVVYVRENGESWITIQGITYRLSCINPPSNGFKVKSFQTKDQ